MFQIMYDMVTWTMTIKEEFMISVVNTANCTENINTTFNIQKLLQFYLTLLFPSQWSNSLETFHPHTLISLSAQPILTIFFWKFFRNEKVNDNLHWK